eukprot:CAMPEP_0181107752 /NCGR_PEP_ID=MMETSP1071-20121207/17253_1 /TAXON_ID=35127 /ORGANISM="Thalassiosira sp., Strain NH16" /LENGTH=297 /DNA_ID=CAMNT_0023191287 /DNA_START=295 /DNA_END=1188 /DNA_ORIENTATION=-
MKSLGPELQALIMFAIDYNCMHYLSGATACEMVYGLKRSKIVKSSTRHTLVKIPTVKNNNPRPGDVFQPVNQKSSDNIHHDSRLTELTNFDKTSSALLAAVLPYCKERCDQWYNEWKEQPTDSPNYDSPNNTSTNRRNASIDSQQKFVQLYPYFHMVHEGSIFLYQFAYLVGYTPYWNFSMHALGVMLRRMTVADVQQQKQQQQRHQSQQNGGALPSQMSTPDNVISSAKNRPKLSFPRMLRGAVLLSVSYTLLSRWYSHFKRELRLRRRRWIAGDEEMSASQIEGGGNVCITNRGG